MVRASRLVALAAVALVAAGCGVGAGGGAQAIPSGQVPFHLLTKEPPSTTTTVPAAVPITVYFESGAGQTLTTAQRTVPVDNTVRTVVHALLAGPTTLEKSAGVRTAISQGVQLLKAKPERPTGTSATGVITLDFNQAFGAISGTQQVLAVAQIVYTVTDYMGAGYAVLFQIEGVATDVPTATGAQVTGPVKRTTYASLAPS